MDWVLNTGEVIVRAVVSIAVLFVLAKLMGSKQISQLNFFDYVVGITIGSVAAEMSFDIDVPFYYYLTSMAVYAVVAVLISIATNKSIRMRRFMNGTPIVIINKGEIIMKNLKKERLDLNELVAICRGQGYFNVADIHYAIMETNGQLSILPYSRKRPVTPEDMNLSPQEEGLCANVVIDGKVMVKHLQAVGKNEEWLKNQLDELGVKSVKDVILGICDGNNQFSAYLKNNVKPQKIFD